MSSVLTFMMQSGSAIEWAGAIGAMLAGVGALAVVAWYVWKHFDVQKIKFRGCCDVRKDVPIRSCKVPIGRSKEDRLLLVIENCGNRSVTITDIIVKSGKKETPRKVIFNFLLDPEPPFCFRTTTTVAEFPFEIDGGKQVDLEFSLKATAKYIVDYGTVVQTKKDAKKLQFVVHTIGGRHELIKPKKPVVTAIMEAVRNKTD